MLLIKLSILALYIVMPVRSVLASPSQRLVAPSEVTLGNNIRKVDMNSALGPIELRWPRAVEKLFGRTPERAVADAALTASRALKQKNFSPRVKNLRLNWQIVFLDDELPQGQIPEYLRHSCNHPGWMTPPSNIYIVAPRVAGACEGRAASRAVADSDLARILLHEIGHVVEFYLLEKQLPFERMRSEGFATWFESFSADHSSLISKGSLAGLHRSQALRSIQASPGVFLFRGSSEDYSRASMYFRGIENRFGMSGLLRVYEKVADERISFIQAAREELVLKESELEDIALRASRR